MANSDRLVERQRRDVWLLPASHAACRNPQLKLDAGHKVSDDDRMLPRTKPRDRISEIGRRAGRVAAVGAATAATVIGVTPAPAGAASSGWVPGNSGFNFAGTASTGCMAATMDWGDGSGNTTGTAHVWSAAYNPGNCGGAVVQPGTWLQAKVTITKNGGVCKTALTANSNPTNWHFTQRTCVDDPGNQTWQVISEGRVFKGWNQCQAWGGCVGVGADFFLYGTAQTAVNQH